MTDTTVTNMNRQLEPGDSEQARQHAQPGQGDPSGLEAQRNPSGSSGQRTTPGRKPLFRS